MTDSYEYIEVTVDGDVFRIALDRPDVLNALGPKVGSELSPAIREAADSDARIVVITGNGEAFSAGGDIEEMQARTGEDGREDLEFWMNMIERGSHVEELLTLTKPLITRVNGDAVGAGATLATLGDIVVASEDARIGDPHVGVGLVVPDNVAFWPFFSDLHTAKEMLMTGKLVSAEEAKRAGLVNHVVPPDDLDTKVDEVVDELAHIPQPALRFTKMLLNKWLRFGSNYMRTEALALETVTTQLPDHAEFVDAFVNDRSPDYPTARSRRE